MISFSVDSASGVELGPVEIEVHHAAVRQRLRRRGRRLDHRHLARPARGSRRCAWCSTASSAPFSSTGSPRLGHQGVADAIGPGAEHADLGVLRCARLGADDRGRQGQRRRAGEDLPKHGMIPFLTLSKPPARSLRAPLSSASRARPPVRLQLTLPRVSPTFSPELRLVVHRYCTKGKYTVSQDCHAAPTTRGRGLRACGMTSAPARAAR